MYLGYYIILFDTQNFPNIRYFCSYFKRKKLRFREGSGQLKATQLERSRVKLNSSLLIMKPHFNHLENILKPPAPDQAPTESHTMGIFLSFMELQIWGQVSPAMRTVRRGNQMAPGRVKAAATAPTPSPDKQSQPELASCLQQVVRRTFPSTSSSAWSAWGHPHRGSSARSGLPFPTAPE